MSESEDVYSKLDELNVRFGRRIPENVLKYFLKENNGDIHKCIEGLEKNQWFKRRHTSDIEPTRAVDSYQRSSSQFLSTSQGSAELSSQLHQQHHPLYPSSTRPSLRNYPDVFQPHPPLLPNSTSPIYRQQTNDVPRPSTNDMPHPSYTPYSNTDPLSQMPVKVPYTQQMSSSRKPGYTKQLSEADREVIMRLQQESMMRAQLERENTVAQLERLKRKVGSQNEELRTLKRENSRTRIPPDEEMQLTEIIIETLKSDIREEQEKRKSRNWTCNGCNFINNYKMMFCESCNEPRLNPAYVPAGSPQLPRQLSGAGQLPRPSQFNNPNQPPHGQGYNYRYR